MDVNRLLNSIGKKCFIDYYYDFKSNNAYERLPIEYTDAGKKIRVASAKTIFKNGLQIEALEICSNSNRLDYGTVNRAKELLELEKNTKGL